MRPRRSRLTVSSATSTRASCTRVTKATRVPSGDNAGAAKSVSVAKSAMLGAAGAVAGTPAPNNSAAHAAPQLNAVLIAPSQDDQTTAGLWDAGYRRIDVRRGQAGAAQT